MQKLNWTSQTRLDTMQQTMLTNDPNNALKSGENVV
jgi:hypothetical protein